MSAVTALAAVALASPQKTRPVTFGEGDDTGFGVLDTDFAAPDLTFDTTNATGDSSKVLATNATLAIFDTASPTILDFLSSTAGTAAVAARRDHRHAISVDNIIAASPSFVYASATAAGSAETFVRSDATLDIFDDTAPSTLGTAAVVGTAAIAARRDHQHEFPETLQSDANSSTLTLTDDGSIETLTGNIDIKITPASGGVGDIILDSSQLSTHRTIIGTASFGATTKFQVRVSDGFDAAAVTSAMGFHIKGGDNGTGQQYNGINSLIESGTDNADNLAVYRGFRVDARMKGNNKTMAQVHGMLHITQWLLDGSSSVLTTDAGLMVLTTTFQNSLAVTTNKYGLLYQTQLPVRVANSYGVFSEDKCHIESPSARAETCLDLLQKATGAAAGAHINFDDKAGDPPSPNAGDYWRNADDIKFEGSGGTQVTVWEGETQTLAAKTFSGFTMADATDIVLNTTTGTKIGTATSQKLGFYNATPVVQPTALTTQDTNITHTAPGTPDFAIQDLVDSGVGSTFGFATKDEGNTVLQVLSNLQTRVGEVETKLQAVGLLA